MSLPIAAGGPVKVEMKPIFTVFCWPIAGPAASANTVPAAIHTFLIWPLLWWATADASKHIKVLTVLPFADVGLFRVVGRFLAAPRDLSFLHISIIVHKSFAKSGTETGTRT